MKFKLKNGRSFNFSNLSPIAGTTLFFRKIDYDKKILIEVFACWLATGPYFAFDNPAALHHSMKTHFSN